MAKNDPSKIRPSRYSETPNIRRVAGDTPAQRKLRYERRHGYNISRELRQHRRGGFKDFVKSLPHRLEDDTFGGLLLIGAAVFAMLWANSPFRGIYQAMSSYQVGPEALGLNLSVATWAADGLLAIFFFVVGLELKTEFVTGSLRDIKTAALPMIAAVGGVIGPALIYLFVQSVTGTGAQNGWAIPSATDIAFALAILAVFGRGLPPALRTFLLTLAVVDDLLVILIIAFFYTETIAFGYLAVSFAAIALFGLLVQKRITKWYLLVPIAVVAWWAMHEAGVHATISAVALGLLVPAARRRGEEQMTHRFVKMWNPISAGIAVPVFAFFAAGINVVDSGGLGEVVRDPISIGIIIGLPLGKLLGIWGTVVVLTQFTRLRLGNGIDRPDIFAVGLLAGIGFTVALLVANLAFPAGSTEVDHAAMGVILGTLISAFAGGTALRRRANVHAR
ncbi:MAG: Na+/H+ antiporter NhaA [Actinomycetaceae bacterium]|nr:Na+/H+ antiporter NhaA [Actinomycetaceae bacterium]